MATQRARSSTSTRLAGLVLLCASAAPIGGCVQSLPYSELPSLSKDTKPILTAEQQKAAVGDLAAKKEAKRSEVIKAIETSK